MRPRKLTTSKILAVALTAGAGAAAVAAEPGSVTAAASRSAPAVSVRAESPKLLALRERLLATKGSAASKQAGRFRPLCDAAGYPLVGNLARKADPATVSDPGLQPSEYCATVRAHRAR